jgi:hypothetical protein
MRRLFPCLRVVILLTACAALPPVSARAEAQTAPAATPTAVEQPAPTLAEARAKAGAARGAALAPTLDALSAALPPRDALSLLVEYLPNVSVPAERSALALRAGDLSLLLGLYQEAASRYEEASSYSKGGREGALLLRAARARLAAGEADRAADLASIVLLSSSGDPALSASARLVGAWALAAQDRASEARAMAQAIAGQSPASGVSAEIKREALFICWAVSEAEDKSAAASRLASEFPGSAEALVASGAMSTAAVPHWYIGPLALSRFSPPPSASPKNEASAVESTAADDGPSAAVAQADRPTRYQVGYYSKQENAKSVMEKLISLGFAATLETRPQVRAKVGDDGRRWAVVVEAGKDPERTQARLKDAGYESYPLF